MSAMSAEDSIRAAFDSQYQAGLDMLEAAVRSCPDDARDAAGHGNRCTCSSRCRSTAPSV